jgi:glycosyltransferase involved in cell wall biosynthesis
MEITIVNEYYPPYVTGGTELFLQSLAEFLVSKGHEVKVVCTLQKDQKETERQGKIEIHRVKSSPIRIGHRYQIPGVTFYWNNFNRAVKAKVKEVAKDSDIVYINNSRHVSLAPFQAAKEMGKKIVLDVHDYWPICFKKDMFKSGKVCRNRSAWECTKCVYGRTKLAAPLLYPSMYVDYELRRKNITFDKAICHSEWMASMLPFESEVIPYPLRERPKGVKPKSIDSQIGLLFAGRIQLQKGVMIFPELARILMDRGVNFRFGFVGSGELEEKLKKEMEDAPATFYGWVSDFKTKSEIFAEHHILLAPSVWAEPFGMVVTEAMSFATPSIVSNYGGLKEIVERNKCGIAVKPTAKEFAEAVAGITNVKYRKMSANCLKGVKNYEKSKIMNRYLEAFKNIVKS